MLLFPMRTISDGESVYDAVVSSASLQLCGQDPKAKDAVGGCLLG